MSFTNKHYSKKNVDELNNIYLKKNFNNHQYVIDSIKKLENDNLIVKDMIDLNMSSNKKLCSNNSNTELQLNYN